MGVKAEAKPKIKAKVKGKLKKVKLKVKGGAAALVGHELGDDEESLLQKRKDKAEGETGRVAKSGNGFPKLMISEPGRQAFWFFIVTISVISCQAGLAFSFLGGTLRPTLEKHDILMNHYGKMQATLNVGKAGSFIVIVGLMMVKGSAFQLVAALLARQKRKSRRRCAVKLAFGCVIFEVVFIVLMCVATALFATWLNEFHASYRDVFPQALVSGYLRNVSITAYVNWLQFRFKCCGATDYKDWFIADWQHRQWMVNRYPTVFYYRDKIYATGRKVGGSVAGTNIAVAVDGGTLPRVERDGSTDQLRAIIHDAAGVYAGSYKNLVTDGLVDEYAAVTSYAEVPFSCCRPDSPSTWCTRQYLVFKLYAYDFRFNSTIFQRGCPRQVEVYINSRLRGLGVALVVLILVRLLNLLLLRLAQTSTFNALVSRRHLSPALGWLITTRRAQTVVQSEEERRLIEHELVSDLDEWDELDEWDGNDDIDSDMDLFVGLGETPDQWEDSSGTTDQSEHGSVTTDQTEDGSGTTDQSEDYSVTTDTLTSSADWETEPTTTTVEDISDVESQESDQMTDVSGLPPAGDV